ncbi:hypothetical protein [Vulcanisaeta sp. JCM 16159]|uniref:hypothetical protein n=1 Tax=Vulcanisaeta sp. JCM 16159 TaxID=1295371 RepID=UPI001FB53FDC|nr:hypothetical protein [Vulcanisaeta sp. JCM 16159]
MVLLSTAALSVSGTSRSHSASAAAALASLQALLSCGSWSLARMSFMALASPMLDDNFFAFLMIVSSGDADLMAR